jgi:MFS family permease
VHGLRNGYDAHTSALLVAAIAAGYAVFQTPLGMLADRMSKRALLCAIAALGLIGALALIPLTRAPVAFFVGLFIWGGIVSGLYMVALAALGHDYDGADLAAANAAFISLYALGMLAGPPAMGAALDASAPAGLFLALAAVFVLYLIAAVFLRKPVAKPVVDS